MSEEGEKLSADIAEASQAGHADPSTNGSKPQKFGTSRADRATSFKLGDFPVLTGREEEWRYTPLERLGGLNLPGGDDERLTGTAPTVTVPETTGVRVETVDRDDSRIGNVLRPDDRVSAASWNSFQQATVITLTENTELNEPLRITITGEHTDPAAQHIVFIAEPNAKADVVLTHEGTAVVAQNIEFDLRDGAGVNAVSIQSWENEQTVHAGTQQASVGPNVAFKHVAVSYGGSLVRLTPTARFTGQGAKALMFGLYFADAGQHLEHRLFIDHAVPKCTSDALYKGALQGQGARTVWVGDVLIRKAAEDTNTYEKNENLLLSDGAQADSIPNLEIETGVIDGAGHASSTGRFDEQQLFYLMARGISEPEARKLIVRGFLNEVIQRIGIEDIQQHLTEVMEDEISGLEL